MTLIDFLFVWTLRSAVLVLLVAIPAFLWKRASASRRHALWLSTLFGTVLLPFLTNLPKWRLPSESVERAVVTPMAVPPAMELPSPAPAEMLVPPTVSPQWTWRDVCL